MVDAGGGGIRGQIVHGITRPYCDDSYLFYMTLFVCFIHAINWIDRCPVKEKEEKETEYFHTPVHIIKVDIIIRPTNVPASN